MSPGPTFDRVYAALKEQLLSGRWAPGAHLEPGVIGEDLAASVTPVRDALHRLVGENLVDAPRHDGFWVPTWTEVQLRVLYVWSGDLAAWALRRQRHAWPQGPGPTAALSDPGPLLLAIARAADHPELERAVAASNDRLAAFRASEPDVLDGTQMELAELEAIRNAGSIARMRSGIAAYHRRRLRAAPLILESRRRSSDLPRP